MREYQLQVSTMITGFVSMTILVCDQVHSEYITPSKVSASIVGSFIQSVPSISAWRLPLLALLRCLLDGSIAEKRHQPGDNTTLNEQSSVGMMGSQQQLYLCHLRADSGKRNIVPDTLPVSIPSNTDRLRWLIFIGIYFEFCKWPN